METFKLPTSREPDWVREIKREEREAKLASDIAELTRKVDALAADLRAALGCEPSFIQDRDPGDETTTRPRYAKWTEELG